MVRLAFYNPTGANSGLTDGDFTIPNLVPGEEYFIYIDGYAGDLCDYYWVPQSGVAITPENDSCDNAITIACGDVDTSNNILATMQFKMESPKNSSLSLLFIA